MPSGIISLTSGGARFGGEAKKIGRDGNGWHKLLMRGYQHRAFFNRGQANVLPPNTQGGSPVRESRPPGSVRGVSSNGYPYRDVRRETGKE